MNLNNVNIKDYLTEKGVVFHERGAEIITKCLFGPCDNNSHSNEGHLYFRTETGQYNCFKCGATGNLVTLAKHFGDTVALQRKRTANFDTELVEKCHLALPSHIREYLRKRGLTDAVIDAHKLGYGQFYRKWWITIPIKDIYGNFSFFKLRQDPALGNDKMTYPKEGATAQIYDWEMLENAEGTLVICEGEMDRLLLLSKGISAITSTHGAGTFKEEWAQKIDKNQKIKALYFCFDNDEAGKKGAEHAIKLFDKDESKQKFIITLPHEVGEKGDITDYFIQLGGSESDLFGKYAKEYPERVDVSQFVPMSAEELIETLGLTIKYDAENKLATFLCELSAYTENAQFNISYNAPSSTGKSFIPTEIARLFPQEDVMEIAYCSPTAFFHDVGQYDKEKNSILVDLSQKILIFLDQPHNELLTRLRPLLSHDKKEIVIKITDKTQKSGTKTKNILLRGFPSVIFCTAGLEIDEQEATRFLLLSPEASQEKIQLGISATIQREADNDGFSSILESNESRYLLKERIRAIKLENIKWINIVGPELIEKRFLGKNKVLKPRHQRDIKRLLSLIKAFALLNVWWRARNGSTITANEDDIHEAFKLWDKISVSQELNLPPYIYNLYREIILLAFDEKNRGRGDDFDEMFGKQGITRQEVLDKHFKVYGRMLNNHQLRQQILPMLETAGLIIQEQDPNDKRKVLIFPASAHQTTETERNSEDEGGAKNTTKEDDEIISEDVIF